MRWMMTRREKRQDWFRRRATFRTRKPSGQQSCRQVVPILEKENWIAVAIKQSRWTGLMLWMLSPIKAEVVAWKREPRLLFSLYLQDTPPFFSLTAVTAAYQQLSLSHIVGRSLLSVLHGKHRHSIFFTTTITIFLGGWQHFLNFAGAAVEACAAPKLKSCTPWRGWSEALSLFFFNYSSFSGR